MLHFLLYDNRSGSTLLSALLSRYEGVSVSQESGFVYRIMEHRGALDRRGIERLVERFYDEPQFRELGLDRADLIRRLMDSDVADKQAMVEAVARFYFDHHTPLATTRIIKGPRLFFNLARLARVFPDARFITIVRDGRAVFASKRKSRSLDGMTMEDNLLRAVSDWKMKLRYTRRHAARVVSVSYERLVDDPDSCCEAILRALPEIATPPRISKPQAAYFAVIGRSQAHLHQNVAAQPDPRIAERWRGELDEVDTALYEGLASVALHRAGYAPTIARPWPADLSARVALRWACYAVDLVRAKLANLAAHARRRRLLELCSRKVYELRQRPS